MTVSLYVSYCCLSMPVYGYIHTYCTMDGMGKGVGVLKTTIMSSRPYSTYSKVRKGIDRWGFSWWSKAYSTKGIYKIINYIRYVTFLFAGIVIWAHDDKEDEEKSECYHVVYCTYKRNGSRAGKWTFHGTNTHIEDSLNPEVISIEKTPDWMSVKVWFCPWWLIDDWWWEEEERRGGWLKHANRAFMCEWVWVLAVSSMGKKKRKQAHHPFVLNGISPTTQQSEFSFFPPTPLPS